MTTTTQPQTSYDAFSRLHLLSLLQKKDSLLEKKDANVAQLEQEKARLEQEKAHVMKTYESLLLAYELLKRQIFGQKSERLSPEQQAFAWAAAMKEVGLEGLVLPKPPGDDTPEEPKKERKQAPHGRRPIDEMNLPEVVIEIPPAFLPEGAILIDQDTTYRLEYQRGHFVKVKIVRRIFKSPAAGDEVSIFQAEPPHEMIPKGMLGPGLVAHILVGKFADHLPFHRQEQIFARMGMPIDRATMGRAAKACGELAQGVVDASWEYAKKTALVFSADATGVLVQHPEKCRSGHFFVALADEDFAFFHFAPKHNHTVPLDLFAGFHGYFQADASSIYHALYRSENGPTEVGCHAHARRKFYNALGEDAEKASVGLGFFNALFALECEADDAKLGPSRRRSMRQARAAPILKELFDWCEREQKARGKERGLIAQALGYALNQREALTRYLENGKLKISNNHSERALRAIAVGRKNWLFVASDEHAEASAVLISLIASCKLHKLNPEMYLRDLFRVLPGWPRARLLELAPKFWTWTRARLNASELEASYGDMTVPPACELPSDKREDADRD